MASKEECTSNYTVDFSVSLPLFNYCGVVSASQSPLNARSREILCRVRPSATLTKLDRSDPRVRGSFYLSSINNLSIVDLHPTRRQQLHQKPDTLAT